MLEISRLKSPVTRVRVSSFDEVQDPPKTYLPAIQEQSRSAKASRHCKQFWWFYLVVVGAIIVISVVVPIRLSKPREDPVQVQRIIDKVVLSVLDQYVTTPNAEDVHLAFDLGIDDNGAPVTPHLREFNASLYLPGKEPKVAFTRLNFLGRSSDTYQTVGGHASMPAPILDSQEFGKYMKSLLGNETFSVGINGTTSIYLGSTVSQDYSIDIDKTVQINGTNLAGNFMLNLLTSYLYKTPLKDGTTITTEVRIANDETRTTIELGHVSFAIYLATNDTTKSSSPIGSMLIPDVAITPNGNNFHEARINMAIDPLIALEDSQGLVNLRWQGNSSSDSNGRRLAYLEDALRTIDFNMPLNLRYLRNQTQSRG